jgi:hypothetical protein
MSSKHAYMSEAKQQKKAHTIDVHDIALCMTVQSMATAILYDALAYGADRPNT